MHRNTCYLWAGLALIFIHHALFAQAEAKPAPWEYRVKTYDGKLSGSQRLKGVVDKIDQDGITLVEIVEKTSAVREHLFAPHDTLRAGKVLDSASGPYSYRWEDVKRGDTVELWVNQDRFDKVDYCIQIFITRRPKGKLPKCQKPKEYPEFPCLQMYNDIENGEDVSDDDIKKHFPGRAERNDLGVIFPAIPPGLPKEWQAKLDAIRAKKKDAVKAPPPEKK